MPRERIIRLGVAALSDRDLVATLLGSGSPAVNVITLAEHVLRVLERVDFRATMDHLLAVPGMGPAKSGLVLAALELGRRIVAPRDYRIRYPADVLPLLHHFADRKQEHFVSVSLNGAHEVITVHVVSVGLVNRTLVHPREVFASPIAERAAAVIIAHNHPSGSVEPSREDRAVTRNLVEAGEVLGIRVLDHIIFSPHRHFSFLETGEL